MSKITYICTECKPLSPCILSHGTDGNQGEPECPYKNLSEIACIAKFKKITVLPVDSEK